MTYVVEQLVRLAHHVSQFFQLQIVLDQSVGVAIHFAQIRLQLLQTGFQVDDLTRCRRLWILVRLDDWDFEAHDFALKES